MFFLENAWLIPLVPVVSFFVILFFGRRLPMRGAEIGVTALVICFGLSLATAGSWVARDETLEVQHGGAHGDGGAAEDHAEDGEADHADDEDGDHADGEDAEEHGLGG